MNERERQLSIASELLLGRDVRLLGVCQQYGISKATALRHLGTLRAMGCEIESVARPGAAPIYVLRNPDAVRLRVGVWLRLERERSVVGGIGIGHQMVMPL